MDEHDGLDLLATLTGTKSIEVGAMSLIDEMAEENERETAKALTTTAPMVLPSTTTPLMGAVSSSSGGSSGRKVKFVSKIAVDLSFDEKGDAKGRYLSEPSYWNGANWTVLLIRSSEDLSNSDCYVGVDNTSALAQDFNFNGKATMRLLGEDGKTPVQSKDESESNWCELSVFHTQHPNRTDRGWDSFIKHEDAQKLVKFHAAREIYDGGEEDTPEYILYLEVTLEREFQVTRLNLLDYNSKKATGMVGIINQGATCYLNALLQMLFHLNYFRKTVFAIPHENQTLGKSTVLGLQNTFKNLQFSRFAVDTKSLTDGFGWSSLEAFQQQDVRFSLPCRALLSFLLGDFIGSLYFLSVRCVRCVRCLRCLRCHSTP